MAFCYVNLAQAKEIPAQIYGLNFEKGKVYTNVSSINLLFNQKVQEQDINIYMSVEGDVNFSLITRHGDIFELNVYYNKIKVMMQMPKETLQFDSSNPQKNPISAMFNAITGHPFRVQLNKFGEVVKIEDMDNLINKAFQKFSNLSQEQESEIKKILRNSLGAKSFKESFEDSMTVFSSDAVEVGDSWKKSYTRENTAGIAFSKETTFVLKKVTKKFLFVDVQAEVKTLNSSSGKQSKSPIRYELAGANVGTMKIDRQSGWTLNSKSEMLLKGKGYGTGASPKIPAGFEIPAFLFSEQKGKGKIK